MFNLAILSSQEPKQGSHLQRLSEQLSLPLVNSEKITNFDALLFFDKHNRLALRPTDKQISGPVFTDFCSGSIRHRLCYGGGKGQAIAKSIRIKDLKTSETKVIDATAGLGVDGFILASLGCHVRMIEQSPIVYHLLADGLQRALLNPTTQKIASRIQLIQADSCAWFDSHSLETGNCDIVYLDPMFPAKKKQAAVKKEMQMLQHLLKNNSPKLASSESADEKLLEKALNICRIRVVVKRPRYAPLIANKKPSFSLNGKSTRFDCFSK